MSLAATQDKEVAVADDLKPELVTGTFTLHRLQHQFERMTNLPVPAVASVQHERSIAKLHLKGSPIG
ncbi:hypothetical protein [Stenomitos frigidus]|uniref:hypothetical protein n=1 Tax=Stenomitos frigidus TaxID=1886765 RepID=UPI0015E79D4E